MIIGRLIFLFASAVSLCLLFYYFDERKDK